MTPILCIFAALIVSAITTMIFMPWFLGLCHKLQITYTTEGQHKFRIPRIGGMIMAPAMAIGLSVYISLTTHYGTIADTIKSSTILIATGLMVVYLLGTIDDIFGLNKWQKRFFLLGVSVAFPLCNLCINNLYGFFGIYEITSIWPYVITIIATFIIVKSIEAFNDSDGLAGGICMVALLLFTPIYIYLGCYSYSATAAAMLGTLLVYLYYNIFGDERIGTKTYMGHAGSLMLSFCIVYLAFKYSMVNTNVKDVSSDGLLLPMSMLWLPVFDYLRVLILTHWHALTKQQRRNSYIHHLLEAKGFSEHKSVSIVLAFSTLVLLANILIHHFIGCNITFIIILDIIAYSITITCITRGKVAHKVIIQDVPNFQQFKGEEGLVSVIMPTWNSEKFVAESIESILAQTYTNWELIITDDCSKDGTMDILRKYAEKDKRIRVQQNEKNGGAGISRNNSISAARGQYIAFCDSDDRWTRDKLEKQLEYMQSKDIALCFAPYYTCDDRSQYLGYVSAPSRVNLFQMMCDNKIGFLTAIYDTSKLGKHPMPPQRKRQDHALLLNLLKICNHAYSIHEPLAHYRIHAGNMSGNKISLLKYNAHTYTAVFGWSKPLSYIFLFTFFMPTYFVKRIKNILINIVRAA